MNNAEISEEELDKFYEVVKKDVEAHGYYLNTDIEFTKDLLKNILVNEKRYGYGSCPCRLASGVKEEDLDIICPCDYRDPDLNDYNACYCALYVTKDVVEGKTKIEPIPERRPSPQEREQAKKTAAEGLLSPTGIPVFRCSVCGYLCAREEPPEICPICKVSKERFKRFL